MNNNDFNKALVDKIAELINVEEILDYIFNHKKEYEEYMNRRKKDESNK